jgi:hypothetical protein
MATESKSPANEIIDLVSSQTQPTQAHDIQFGTASEITNHQLLEAYLNKTLNRKGGYAVFDFEDPSRTCYVELKTRRIAHDKYPTAMIGLNKIAFCVSEPDIEYWFVFCYTDGLYTIKYDREIFNTFEVSHSFRRGERADCPTANQSVVYIPVELLQKINPEDYVKKACGGAGGESPDGV